MYRKPKSIDEEFLYFKNKFKLKRLHLTTIKDKYILFPNDMKKYEAFFFKRTYSDQRSDQFVVLENKILSYLNLQLMLHEIGHARQDVLHMNWQNKINYFAQEVEAESFAKMCMMKYYGKVAHYWLPEYDTYAKMIDKNHKLSNLSVYDWAHKFCKRINKELLKMIQNNFEDYKKYERKTGKKNSF
jgi:hypothetical protein